MEDIIWTTPLQHCTKCSGKLNIVGSKKIPAIVYGKQGKTEGYHQAKRCNKRDCQSLHWTNYRWESGKKIGTLLNE